MSRCRNHIGALLVTIPRVTGGGRHVQLAFQPARHASFYII
jgi:hypothetical protein